MESPDPYPSQPVRTDNIFGQDTNSLVQKWRLNIADCSETRFTWILSHIRQESTLKHYIKVFLIFFFFTPPISQMKAYWKTIDLKSSHISLLMYKMIQDCALIGKPIHYLKLQDYRKLTLFLPKIYNRFVLKAGGNERVKIH